MHGNSAHKQPGIVENPAMTPSPPQIVLIIILSVSASEFNFRGVTSAEKSGGK